MNEFWDGYPQCRDCKISICVLIGGLDPITNGKCPALGKEFSCSDTMPETGIRCGACSKMFAVEGRFAAFDGRKYLRRCNWCGQLSVVSAVEEGEKRQETLGTRHGRRTPSAFGHSPLAGGEHREGIRDEG